MSRIRRLFRHKDPLHAAFFAPPRQDPPSPATNTAPMGLGARALRFVTTLEGVLRSTRANDAQRRPLSLEGAIDRAVERIAGACAAGGKVLFFGNGGSAANASHMATDYWKLGGLEALAFNDSSLLTCVGNDCGFENLFREPILRFARRGDVAVALSCSGRSPNVLEGVRAARERDCWVLTLSGFDPDNPLRSMGDLNLHVPSHSYGLVEIAQLTFLHAMLDAYLEERTGSSCCVRKGRPPPWLDRSP